MPAIVVVPVVFVGMTVALWTFKCASLVIFQNKIIYMPSLPPYSRSEKLADYQNDCGSVKWREESIQSADGKNLALAIGQVGVGRSKDDASDEQQAPVVILYFQGNGSSTPPRLPVLSRVMASTAQTTDRPVTLAALSYRGYWKSTGRPSQVGIEKDAQSFLAWATRSHPSSDVVIWGQSIGAGIAMSALASMLTSKGEQLAPRITHAILETPFVSMRRMLADLYPQKWLPYRHLWPFLRSTWDSEAALRRLGNSEKLIPPILLLPALDDEVVPKSQADYLEDLCKELKLRHKRVDVAGALHNQASLKPQGRRAIADFITDNRNDRTERL
ncbi:hypothetical protein CAC42_1003 [Sphaceloma murrayae]|uniref:Protein bem46 n=1 Tax=Sphaceloma murrayae TaxID=2082308 RepID=A0A2K1R1R1_9PEZI|nr:hypothetical protein CAC42_1003 [Sphaceloma murrayae]